MAHDVSAAERREARSVIAWRERLLRGAGFPGGLAKRVAGDRAYDVHGLIDLAERGCPPELAVRILAPIEERS
jgi:hypothetical protein